MMAAAHQLHQRCLQHNQQAFRAHRPSKGRVTPLRQVDCASHDSSYTAVQQQRRGLLAALALATAGLPNVANAGFGWDGTSSAQGSCALGDEGDECRRQTLLKSQSKGQASYADVSKIDRPLQNSVGIPVAQMDDAYSKETLALAEVVDKYASMDLYDAERPKLVGELRKEAGQWVAKYARGGSARKLSARRFYIAVDALQGHLASNGQAPFPRQKIPVLQANVQQARDLIAQGK